MVKTSSSTTDTPTSGPARTYMPLREIHLHRPWATERYVRRLVDERRISFSKVGGRVLVALEDLDVLTEAGRVEPIRKTS